MRHGSCWASVLLILWMIQPISAAGSDKTVMEISPVRLLPPSLHEKWFHYRVLQDQQKWGPAHEALESLKKQAVDQGIDNIDLLSAVLLEDAREALAGGNVERALDLSSEAQSLSPNYVPAYFFRGRILLQHQPWNIFEWIGEYVNGWAESGKHIWVLLYLFGKTFLWLIIAGGAAGLIFVLMIVLRYTPRLQHTLLESFRRKVGGVTCWFLTGILLLGPFWLGLSLAWAFPWWLVLFWSFMTKPERWIGLVFTVLLAMSGLWLPAWIAILESKNSTSFVFLSSAVRSGVGSTQVLSPPDIGRLDRNDGRLAMSLGLYYKKLGRFDEARSFFEKALETDPGDERLLINLGNLNFLSNRIDDAMRSYQKALELNPASVEAYFNLAQAYREKLLFDEGERQYQEAVRIDPVKTKAYTRRTVEIESRPVVDVPLTLVEVLPAALVVTAEHKKQADRLFVSVWKVPLSTVPWIGLGFGFLFLLISFRVLGVKHLPFPCSLCRRTICLRCLRHIFHLRICAECHEMNRKVKRVTELYQMRHHKKRQVTLARFGSIFLPGLGHFYLLRPVKGFFFSFAFFTLIFVAFWREVPVSVPYDHTFSEGWAGLVIAGVGLALLYIWVFRDLSRAEYLMDRG